MDPNTALENARNAVDRYQAAGDIVDADSAANDLVTAFASLDEWISGGGFLPDAWLPSQTMRR